MAQTRLKRRQQYAIKRMVGKADTYGMRTSKPNSLGIVQYGRFIPDPSSHLHPPPPPRPPCHSFGDAPRLPPRQRLELQRKSLLYMHLDYHPESRKYCLNSPCSKTLHGTRRPRTIHSPLSWDLRWFSSRSCHRSQALWTIPE